MSDLGRRLNELEKLWPPPASGEPSPEDWAALKEAAARIAVERDLPADEVFDEVVRTIRTEGWNPPR